MRRLAATAVGLALALAVPASAAAAQAPAVKPNSAVTVPPSLDKPPPGYTRTGTEVSRTADAVARIRRERARYAHTYARPYLKGPPALRRWQVSFYATLRAGRKEIGQVIVADRTGRVQEVWTGHQVAWTMARGYPGAFGRKANAPYVWLTLCVLFLLPFLRPPLRLLHLDLAVLLAFSVSYAFFQDARIGVSVPSVYPLLLYLLVRMLATAVARARGREPAGRPPLRLAVPYVFLTIAVIFLIGFRIGLNIVDGNVIDVGYAGVIGADRVLDGDPVYGGYPPDNRRGDTYGPVNYYAYVPFAAALPWGGRWDDLPAAHGAAIAFDLACVLLLFLVGRRIRGPGLGILLAYEWATYPFTLLVSNSNANDALPAALTLLALLLAGRPLARGGAVALAGLTKFAPLALAPLLATYRGGSRAGEWGEGKPPRALARPIALTAAGFAAAAAVVLIPVFLLGTDARELYDRTLGFQNERGSPFSVWGLYDLPGLQTVAKLAAVALALLVAFVPRRRDVVVLAALGAAVLIALQLGVSHWFYLYLVWFFPLVLVALLAPHTEPDPPPPLL
ncbi:MAG TPA: hypothetical protein VF533_21840 [Solirubrobacteraceae bacterium]